MDHQYLIDRLEENGPAIVGLLSGVSPPQATWRDRPDRWSLIEAAAHLSDEEWEDFKPRLIGVLSDDDYLPPALDDPDKRAADRHYSEWLLPDTLAKFQDERRKSVEYLRSLTSPDWKRGFSFPSGFSLSAEGILSSWVAHDLLHMRQITAIHFLYLEVHVKPGNVEYAGVFDTPIR